VERRIADQLAAGADHVCLQALPAEPFTVPARQWKLLAAMESTRTDSNLPASK
jgi:hypothetical protein